MDRDDYTGFVLLTKLWVLVLLNLILVRVALFVWGIY